MERSKIKTGRIVAGVLGAAALSVMSLSAVQPAAAQSAEGVFVGGVTTAALQPDDLIGSSGVGVQAGFRSPSGILFLGEYIYTGKDYYYPDAEGWKKAASWSEVPSGSDVSRDEWIFYRTRHVLGGAAGFSAAVDQIGLFGAAGLTFNIIALAEAKDYYPEFGDAAKESSIGDGTVLMTTNLRAGLVFPAEGPIAGQLSYMMMFEPVGETAGEQTYIRRNSLIYLGVSLQLGGM
ncbi:MAG: hypothetical protein ACLFSA_06795 [Spirochaetaceae bacterium]